MRERTPEQERLDQHHNRKANWKLWGPYLSDRSWGTVREDYSENDDAWNYFPHDHARSRAYRWNEDGLGGICDRDQYLCFSHCFWNGCDPILKERFFGLSNQEGNHGEDVKEYYYHLDNTPTHSYMKMLYKYPQVPFPYDKLVSENKKRGLKDDEYELLDTGIFNEGRYFDIFIEYAKASEDEVLIRLQIHNRGKEAAPLTVLPTLWFRNTWSWGYSNGPMHDVKGMPSMVPYPVPDKELLGIEANHPTAGKYILYGEDAQDILFTNNDTNQERIFKIPNATPYVKDAFHRNIIHKEKGAINPNHEGTKATFLYTKMVEPREVWTIRLHLSKSGRPALDDFDGVFNMRLQEANLFYESFQNPKTSPEENQLQRNSYAGLLWTKQLYYYDVEQWRHGDPAFPNHRKTTPKRNAGWENLVNFDIISMPDKWEYPWYASWDLAFHCVSLVTIDPDFVKRQLTLMLREWYMNPNGQIPAYEWNFSDLNPPVLAWAVWRVYKIDARINGVLDRQFLAGAFHKMIMNFTWWLNREDAGGKNIFQGGFLGLDNISLFDRSKPLPSGGHIYQSDATAWMGFFCVIMMKISMELARDFPVYENLATKYFEHFLRIGAAMINCGGGKGMSLWNKEDGFFYDIVQLPDEKVVSLKVRSLVGLLPLLAVDTYSNDFLEQYPLFKRRMQWFLNRHPELENNIASMDGFNGNHLLSFLTRDRLTSVLRYMLDETEFLSDHGIRSLSKYHKDHPYSISIGGVSSSIDYEPGVSKSRLFGGNSNWRGPVWMPLNFLIIESLQKFHYFYGDTFKIECPTGSGNWMNLWDLSKELSKRLLKLFTPGPSGKTPIYGDISLYSDDPYWQGLPQFNEYFDGDTGFGLGASHQTGWTGLVAKLIQQSGRSDERTWPKELKSFKVK